MAVGLYTNFVRPSFTITSSRKSTEIRRRFCVENCSSSKLNADNHYRTLVLEVKKKLGEDYGTLPVGKNGRDDEEMILWFLRDRKFSVDDAIMKLSKAIKWRQDFGVSKLTEDSVKHVAETGKSFVHNFLDVNGRPVFVVVASKHIRTDPIDDEKLCVFLIEKALSKLPAGKEQILGIVDLRGFGIENADVKFLTFLFDVFYYYYPKRLGEVLFVEAPFVFQPVWQLAKPMLKSYASLPLLLKVTCLLAGRATLFKSFCRIMNCTSPPLLHILVRFCSVETVCKEYFTEETLPANFSNVGI
ncbi:hypothetical protein Ancab_035831 [Ancistrocladus abbreviatus]